VQDAGQRVIRDLLETELKVGLLTQEDKVKAMGFPGRATASKIPVILAVLDGNLVCSYNVYY